MAFGDSSIGDVQWMINANTLRVTFTSGDRAGETWNVRAATARAALRTGPGRFVGQSAMALAESKGFGAGGRVRVSEFGRDQYGRLAGFVENAVTFDELGFELQVGGFSTLPDVEQMGNVRIITWPTLAVGVFRTSPIIIDETEP